MKYKRVKARIHEAVLDEETEKMVIVETKKDYLEWKGRDVIFRAPDTPDGKAILDRRREREEPD